MQALCLVVVALCATMQLAGDATRTAACRDHDLPSSVHVLGIIVRLQVPCMQV